VATPSGSRIGDAAERKVVEAVVFTLEGDDDASLADAEIRYLNLEIAAS
jgi:hypothetical protein